MNVQPVHQLAVALHSSPKLFACVLGSGLSTTAGIKTGWQIVLDMVTKHAAQLGEHDAAVADPAAWYAKKYGGDPNYSDIVHRLARTPLERRGLLEPYFTQFDAVEQEHHEHVPTDAHRAIAKLVKRGVLRVILTTNFDRLMERALREAGVARVDVVTSESAAQDAPPFHCSEAFVFKLHGDWRDPGLLNSPEELAAYTPPISRLLRRILEEHGLIVCGWSAEYDIALRDAIAERNRRFPIYWADPNPSASTAKRIASLGAEHISAAGDEFFDQLELAVHALDRHRPPPALSADVLVAKARRLIADEREMELDDLVQDATRALCNWIENEFLPQRAPGNEWDRMLATAHFDACEARTRPLALLLATLARYTQYTQSRERVQLCLTRLLRAAATAIDARQASSAAIPELFSWPAVLSAYAYGVGCAHRDNWSDAILAMRDAGSGRGLNERHLPPHARLKFAEHFRFINRPEFHFTQRLADWLRDLLEDWIPRRADFNRAFDRWDVLVAVLAMRHLGELSWTPRCVLQVHAEQQRPVGCTFDEVIAWFELALDKARNEKRATALWQAFPDSERGYQDMVDLLRRWAPKT